MTMKRRDIPKAAKITDKGLLNHYRRWLPYAEKQGKYFASIIALYLPRKLDTQIRKERLSILDFGCSCGHLVKLFSETYPLSFVQGVDTDKTRIEIARSYYPECHFTEGNILDLHRTYDCIFSSNVLEHFENPLDVLRNTLIPHANRYIVTLVPYRELNRMDGHVFTFHRDSFPNEIDHFCLIYEKIINCGMNRHDCWPGYQFLTIYKQETE